MKRIIFIFIIIAGLGLTAVSFGTSIPQKQIKLYYTDAQVLKLIPIRTTIPALSTKDQAKLVVKKLIDGDDENLKIKRTIPKIQGCMTVEVNGTTAYVDIKPEMVLSHSEGRDIELLTVYSIVNSLTGIEGINTVKFTIDGKIQKDFIGYIDMRETFIPDYMI